MKIAVHNSEPIQSEQTVSVTHIGGDGKVIRSVDVRPGSSFNANIDMFSVVLVGKINPLPAVVLSEDEISALKSSGPGPLTSFEPNKLPTEVLVRDALRKFVEELSDSLGPADPGKPPIGRRNILGMAYELLDIINATAAGQVEGIDNHDPDFDEAEPVKEKSDALDEILDAHEALYDQSEPRPGGVPDESPATDIDDAPADEVRF